MYGSSLLAVSRHDVAYCLSDVVCLVPIRMARLTILANTVSTQKAEQEDPVKDLLRLRKTLVRPSLIVYIFI